MKTWQESFIFPHQNVSDRFSEAEEKIITNMVFPTMLKKFMVLLYIKLVM